MAVKPLPFAFNAQTPSRAITDALTADLAVIRTQLRPRGKRKAPIDLELHANPAALGIAAVSAGLALWLMQLRLHPQKSAYDGGQYMWPDGTPASDLMTDEWRAANQSIGPYKTIPHPEEGHYEMVTRYREITHPAERWLEDAGPPPIWHYEDARTESVPYENREWIVDVPASVEYIHSEWVSRSWSKKEYSIEQRRGFIFGGILGEGGAVLEDIVTAGPGTQGALQVLGDLVWNPGKFFGMFTK